MRWRGPNRTRPTTLNGEARYWIATLNGEDNTYRNATWDNEDHTKLLLQMASTIQYCYMIWREPYLTATYKIDRTVQDCYIQWQAPYRTTTSKSEAHTKLLHENLRTTQDYLTKYWTATSNGEDLKGLLHKMARIIQDCYIKCWGSISMPYEMERITQDCYLK